MNELPEFSEFGIAAIKLLQGVVYQEDKDVWAILLANESDIETYFCRIGTNVVIDRSNGLAYLKQFGDDQRVDGYERLPRLITRSPLSYQVTLGCVMLRDAYRRFEDEDIENERCIIETEALFDSWKSFFPPEEDDVSLRKKLTTCLGHLEKFKLVRKLKSESGLWEVRRAIKARVPIEQLEQLNQRLAEHISGVVSPVQKSKTKGENIESTV